ncbi:MAG: hypothetical protein PHU85_15080 [Phycisphaerae bacterium]|nr:hypothetical protein [Phycisphaerae bacterium]
MTRILSVCLFALVLPCVAAQADVVELQDGRTIRGKVVDNAASLDVTVETPGGPLTFQRSMVKSIKKDAATPPVNAVNPTSPTTTPNPTTTNPPAAAKGDDRARKEYIAVADKVKTITEPKFVADVWQAYIKEFGNDPMCDLARKELVIWQERAAKDLVLFGPKWLPRADVGGRITKAKELLAKADGEADTKAALILYRQAAEQNPYLIDIPAHKAKRFQDDSDRRNYGLALGDVLTLDPNNVMALNNLGVSAGLDKNWGPAFLNLSKAALASGNDLILANMLQVAYLREYGEEATCTIIREGWHDQWDFEHYTAAQWKEIVRTGMATLTAQEDATLRQMVDKLHAQKKHADEEYWGGKWIPAKDYKDLQNNNGPELKAIRNSVYRIKAIDARGNVYDATVAERKQTYDRILQLRVPDRPGQLVMISESGAEAKALSSDSGVKHSEFPHIWAAEPGPNKSAKRPARFSRPLD